MCVSDKTHGPIRAGMATMRITLHVALAAALVGCSSPPAKLDIPPQAWRMDLEVVRTKLPKLHLNAFHALPRAEFDQEMRTLEADAARENPDARFVGLMAALNRIGDGHTGVVAPPDRAYFPIEIRRFGDELRVSRAAPQAKMALGARVLAIGGLPAEEVLHRTLSLTPADENPPLRLALATNYLSVGLILHGLGIIPQRSQANYQLQQDGGAPFDVTLSSTPSRDKSDWLRSYQKPALADLNPDSPFWCTAAPRARAVYCDFRAYDGLDARARSMFDLLKSSHADKLIIDLRQNGGGDYTVGEADLIRPIAKLAPINRKGHLFVLIGPETFSAAMNNAAQFRSKTAATLVGETIGEKPNSYQEPRELVLPNSHLVVRYSTRWYAFQPHGPNEISPDVRILPSWADYASGRDPAVDYALGH
jgi:hypothetical protein